MTSSVPTGSTGSHKTYEVPSIKPKQDSELQPLTSHIATRQDDEFPLLLVRVCIGICICITEDSSGVLVPTATATATATWKASTGTTTTTATATTAIPAAVAS